MHLLPLSRLSTRILVVSVRSAQEAVQMGRKKRWPRGPVSTSTTSFPWRGIAVPIRHRLKAGIGLAYLKQEREFLGDFGCLSALKKMLVSIGLGSLSGDF